MVREAASAGEGVNCSSPRSAPSPVLRSERKAVLRVRKRARTIAGQRKKIEELYMLIFLNRANDIKPEPLDVGEGKFHLVDLVSQTQGAPVSSGVAEIWKSAPVDFEYDNDCAVCYMIEGEITHTEGDEKVGFLSGTSSIYLRPRVSWCCGRATRTGSFSTSPFLTGAEPVRLVEDPNRSCARRANQVARDSVE